METTGLNERIPVLDMAIALSWLTPIYRYGMLKGYEWMIKQHMIGA